MKLLMNSLLNNLRLKKAGVEVLNKTQQSQLIATRVYFISSLCVQLRSRIIVAIYDTGRSAFVDTKYSIYKQLPTS